MDQHSQKNLVKRNTELETLLTAKNREIEIEAALEKVRSRSLAMHSSDELHEVIKEVFQQMEGLAVRLNVEVYATIIFIFAEDSKDMVWWVESKADQQYSKILVPYADNPYLKDIFDAKENGKDFFSATYFFEEKNELFHHLFEHTDFKHVPETHKKFLLESESATMSVALAKNTGINITSYTGKPFSEKDNEILKRFAKVFDQAYTRFLDLQKAEAQAREATIEAALEKVRGKAMAMHNSNDLSNTASMVFTELKKLGINPIRCGVGLFVKESFKAQIYAATSSAGGDSLALIGWVSLSGHPVLENIYEAWAKNEDCFPVLSGEQLRSYYENLLAGLSLPVVPDWKTGQKQFGHFIAFSIGSLYAWSERPYNDAELKILKRFATVIDLTFRRYAELQKSEASTKEAIKQAALDRIRADIASMRTISDLDSITPLIWNELTTLGVPFTRCGVFIMDSKHELIHSFLSTPDGKAIAAFHLPFNVLGNFAEILSHWIDKKNYIDHWDESAFTELADTLVSQGAIESPDQYLDTIPREGIYLHFLPFLQGMLYVGNTTRLNEEEIQLIQSVADAFSTAYARYEDFKKLEAAKQQVDKTLVDLKQAQTQLVQSEKMASLGELTAGIAHEIQNPLNFVNNFSEVNNELISELIDAVDKGNTEEVIAIAKNIKQNLEKINHHGNRADAIVKGMLQHSRTNPGQKEPTDINALADEYLRLAYHGLRAKEKSFNAKFETDFDNTIGKINIIPQDIGRVVLNLINNAFNALKEKEKQNIPGYEPTVIIATKKVADNVQLSIRDNGKGIPENIVDKIFHPFFTTRPGGHGTGLGLSLAYDIIKAHGGKIKVETKEGEGSEFIIQLPVIENQDA